MNSIAVERVYSAGRINDIVNHPSVYEWVRGACEGPLDLTAAIDGNRNIIALLGEHGVILFHRMQPGLFNCHTQCLPDGRGRWMLDFTNECLKWMFCRTEAVECLTLCPEGNAPAKVLAKAIGGQFEFCNPTGWVIDGKQVKADVYSLTIQRWMQSSPLLAPIGRNFHNRLESEFARLGITEVAHEDDATHDAIVGAAVGMFLGNQPQKAVVFYNRAACMLGWQPIAIVDVDPIVVNIGSALIVMRGDDFIVVPPQKSTQ